MHRLVIIAWGLFILGAIYLYLTHSFLIQYQLEHASESSLYAAYAVFFLFGCIRGFLLIPSTYLIILGLLFFPPLPLYFLTVAGILVSSAGLYFLSEALHLDAFFERRYSASIIKIRSILQKYELPIIIGWSAFPFLPTDVICYVCGTLRVDFKKFILGTFVGEAVTSGIYIFLGHQIIQYIHRAL